MCIHFKFYCFDFQYDNYPQILPCKQSLKGFPITYKIIKVFLEENLRVISPILQGTLLHSFEALSLCSTFLFSILFHKLQLYCLLPTFISAFSPQCDCQFCSSQHYSLETAPGINCDYHRTYLIFSPFLKSHNSLPIV